MEIQQALEDAKATEDVDSRVENVLLVEPADKFFVEKCEKLFVIAKDKIDRYNVGIEHDGTSKLKAKDLKVDILF